MDDPTPPSPNQLLAALPQADFELVRPHLRSVEMEQGAVLVAAGAKLSHVYFPHSGMISLLAVMHDGDAIETAAIGYEGAVGAGVGLNLRRAFTRAVVQDSTCRLRSGLCPQVSPAQLVSAARSLARDALTRA